MKGRMHRVCAHVLADAVGPSDFQSQISGLITLDFQYNVIYLQCES